MKNTKIRQMVQLAILTAIVLVLAFTPLGYLKIGTMTITFLSIPVVIGAILMGPKAGAFLGCVFGITSFVQCFGMDALGTALMTINIFYTFCMTVVTRTLMGFLSGCIYRGCQWLFAKFKIKKRLYSAPVSCAIACAAAPLLNTILFMSTMYICFHNEQVIIDEMGSAPFFAFVFGSVAVNAVAELLASLIIGTAICSALQQTGIIKDNI
ncbi:MAG: ECF transporter S component [Clostridia bacterium]|nr:ECF transporter S component [Clostridia bacterium]